MIVLKLNFNLSIPLSTLLLLILLPTPTHTADCTEAEISQWSTTSCTCHDPNTFTICPHTCPLGPASAQCAPNPNTHLQQCHVGCTDANKDCTTCDLYFGGMCRCTRSQNCFHDASTDPWTLLHDHKLITTSHHTPGILDLHGDNRGWELGQIVFATGTVSSRADGALAMNSVHSRSEEQVHIHVCDRPVSVFRTYLNGIASPAAYTQGLTPMDFDQLGFQKHSVLCRAQKTGLSSAAPCAWYYVGAGLITDQKGYTWGCVTTTGSAEFLFCMN
ncbi:hypothetical protein P168DRAFT_304293 [Aspergillus campestris IBT 28561]|uniref:Uncharacterized protein n=1 Tax=Aspergillus campestris (strain IBT 28561) TaxID=1392248 RepID=A0A2I1D5W5_ASPC2|nr:uncharacterized protein P168DRAFT_304293 [Aspergillus campestris IBT 28561]PKY05260.1 hypothetical protein P168DRAFT_304293 [Aspergillus campestris IBT 28561]